MSFPGSLPLDVLHMCCHTSLLGEVSVPHAAPLGDTWRLMPGFSCTLPHGSLSLTYFYLFPLLVINCNDNKTASGNSLSLRWWFREWTQPPNLSSLKLEKFFFFHIICPFWVDLGERLCSVPLTQVIRLKELLHASAVFDVGKQKHGESCPFLKHLAKLTHNFHSHFIGPNMSLLALR